MTLVLDTHVLLWLGEGGDALSEAARRALEEAGPETVLAVSAISFWEVAMLAERGRIGLGCPVRAYRERALAAGGLVEIPVDGPVALEAVALPDGPHRDPADRFIVATARLAGGVLLTRDEALLDYGARGHVRTLRA